MPSIDEPESAGEEDEHELAAQDEAFHRQYDNEHTWENLQEDEHGNLRVDNLEEQRAKRQRLLTAAQSSRVRKGMIRYLLLVIDLSRAATAQDFRPSRLAAMLRVCRAFVRNFFDQNPLSQLGVVLLSNGVAERLTDLSGSAETHLRKLQGSLPAASGDASLQNALEVVAATLKSVPPYGHREALMLFAGLSTCDPGNIFSTIKECKEARIRVSIVGVSAEVHICRRICEDTGGQYGIALQEAHMEELMMSHAPPPPATSSNVGAELVCMGFPQRSAEDPSATAFAGSDVQLMTGCYICPRCRALVPDLPTECHVCGIILISSPHLARSYHHLFPVAPFEELHSDDVYNLVRDPTISLPAAGQDEVPHPLYCFGCLKNLSFGVGVGMRGSNAGANGGSLTNAILGKHFASPMVLRCTSCNNVFCFDCDTYVHESLHNCPGCECQGGMAGMS